MPIVPFPPPARVYLPPGYEDSDASYPTLYLFHGRGDDELSWQENGLVEALADARVANGGDPLIIVMPYGFVERKHQDSVARKYRYATPAEWRQIVLGDLIPAVEQKFRVRPGRESRAVAGASMGSEQALDLVFNNLNEFSALGCFSPAFPQRRFNAEEVPVRWPELAQYANEPQLSLCYVAWAAGESADWINDMYRPLRRALVDGGIPVSSPENPFPGDHSWRDPNPWSRCLKDFLTRLWPRVRPAEAPRADDPK